MEFTSLIKDREFYNKVPDNLSDEEKEILYINVYKIKKKLTSENANLKQIPKKIRPRKLIDNKKYIRKIICECCGKEMTNKYLYLHKKTKIYKTNMELKKFRDKLNISL